MANEAFLNRPGEKLRARMRAVFGRMIRRTIGRSRSIQCGLRAGKRADLGTFGILQSLIPHGRHNKLLLISVMDGARREKCSGPVDAAPEDATDNERRENRSRRRLTPGRVAGANTRMAVRGQGQASSSCHDDDPWAVNDSFPSSSDWQLASPRLRIWRSATRPAIMRLTRPHPQECRRSPISPHPDRDVGIDDP
jgi:hypothetical protein